MKHTKRFLAVIFALIIAAASGEIRASAKTVPLVTQVATVHAESLRLRSGPSTSYATLGFAPGGDYVLITGKSGVWYQVNHNMRQGYMHERYLKTYLAKNVELGYGTVTANQVNLRAGPGTAYRSLIKADAGEKAYVIGFNQHWYKVIFKEKICYIRSDYLELTQIPYENRDSSNTPIFFRNGVSTGVAPNPEALQNDNTTISRAKIVAEAKKHLGVPYVWGGSTPDGFDCSGFIQFVFMKCGITLPRTTLEQVQSGVYISKKDMQPGDLVFLQNTYRDGVSHVGIYIGNNQMIHASSSKGVTISSLTNSYYLEHYHSSRQVIF